MMYYTDLIIHSGMACLKAVAGRLNTKMWEKIQLCFKETRRSTGTYTKYRYVHEVQVRTRSTGTYTKYRYVHEVLNHMIFFPEILKLLPVSPCTLKKTLQVSTVDNNFMMYFTTPSVSQRM
jgi:hypothetical protein